MKSYPTLKYFVNGAEPVDYDGGRDAESIAEWLRKREKPTVEEIDMAEVESFVETWRFEKKAWQSLIGWCVVG